MGLIIGPAIGGYLAQVLIEYLGNNIIFQPIICS